MDSPIKWAQSSFPYMRAAVCFAPLLATEQEPSLVAKLKRSSSVVTFVNISSALKAPWNMLAKISGIVAALKTFVRGVAKEGEQPVVTVTPVCYFIITLSIFSFSIALPQVVWSNHLRFLLLLFPIDFLFGQAGAWTLYMIHHHAVHEANSRSNQLNAAIAEICSVLCLTNPPKKYKKDHVRKHHRRKTLATSNDPDLRWLVSLGFELGQPISFYWKQLWLTLSSPKYYLVFFAERCYWNFISASLSHRLFTWCWWSLVVFLTFLLNLWIALSAYLIFIILGYGISALLQTLTEHRWGYNGADYSQKTFPRLLPIDKYPGLFLVYLYWRVAILTTDLCQHQIHHREARNLDWTMVAYSEKAQNDLPRAIWGIKSHFQEAFASLSQANPE